MRCLTGVYLCSQYYAECHAVVYVVDSSNPETLAISVQTFSECYATCSCIAVLAAESTCSCSGTKPPLADYDQDSLQVQTILVCFSSSPLLKLLVLKPFVFQTL